MFELCYSYLIGYECSHNTPLYDGPHLAKLANIETARTTRQRSLRVIPPTLRRLDGQIVQSIFVYVAIVVSFMAAGVEFTQNKQAQLDELLEGTK